MYQKLERRKTWNVPSKRETMKRYRLHAFPAFERALKFRNENIAAFVTCYGELVVDIRYCYCNFILKLLYCMLKVPNAEEKATHKCFRTHNFWLFEWSESHMKEHGTAICTISRVGTTQ